MTRIAVLTGLVREAGVLRAAAKGAEDRLEVAVSGADPARAHWEAGHLTRGRPDLLVSFGLAGGLDPALSAGTLVVADAIMLPDGARIAADAKWTAVLRRDAAGAVGGDIVAVDRPILTTADKRVLAGVTGAAACDMESHALARAAQDTGTPFVVLRAICDPATQTVPEPFLRMLDESGRVRRSALPDVLRHPGAALALWRHSRAAHAALARAATILLSL